MIYYTSTHCTTCYVLYLDLCLELHIFWGNHIDLTVKNMIKFSIPLVRLIFDQFETPRAKIGDDYLNVKLVLLKDN